MVDGTISTSNLKEVGLHRKEKEAQIATIPFLDEVLCKLHVNWLQKIIFLKVRDLINCPRQVIYKRINWVQENQNQDKYLKGRLLNIQLQQILLARYPGSFEIEKQVQYNCSNFFRNKGRDSIVYIIGQIDAFNKEIGPLEFKTSKSLEKVREPYSSDLQQIKYYMAMTNSTTALLIYYHLDPKFGDDPSIIFHITITEEQLYREHERLIRIALSLAEAISAGRPEMASHVAYDPRLKWMCKSCPYSTECMNTRIKMNGFKSSLKRSVK
jgi:CRISPR/Cas system-associated exonuclease Cas4 (RecB family)